MKKTKKSSSTSRAVKAHPKAAPHSSAAKYHSSSKKRFSSPAFAKRRVPKTNRPDIRVKKESYSKVVRGSVLSNAPARQLLIEMGGENTIDIIREFDKDMSDEELSKKTGIKASDVRVVLNRLHSHGLFSYTRVRDKDSGWYSYIWKMSEEKLNEFGVKFGQEREPEAVMAPEGENYVCANCSPAKAVKFEDAADAQFKCGNCGSDLEFFEKNRPRGPVQP
ncbi:MAG: hypothetical protein NTV88_04930 [Candidatus Micrarchaeota archaeon]|nr:hypothetical protein [Candidatus Micrarchaeota archaeon]